MQEYNITDKKLFIFDWDGTLADSIAIISSSLVDSFRELKLPPLSDEKARSIIGLGLVDALKMLTPGISDHDRELLLKSYKKFFTERAARGIPLFPGVEKLLEFLYNKGMKIAVATGKSRSGLDRELSQAGLGSLLHATRTIDECNPKPHPHMILDIMKELECRPGETIMIGDTTYDLEMAQNAGVESFAIAGGAHSLETLQDFAPIGFFPDFTAFSDFIVDSSAGL